MISINKKRLSHLIKKHCLIIAVSLALALNFFIVDTAFSSNPPIIPKTIKVIMDSNYPPYAFLDNKGNLQGILIDQWRLWERKTGVVVVITGTDWDKALNSMQTGEFDVIDTIFFNETRARIFDFTKPYAKIDVSIFFHKNISGISDTSSLQGFNVAVKSGDNAIDYLKKKGINNFQEYPSYEAIAQAAKEQKVMVTVIDDPPALYFFCKLGIHNQFRHSAPLYTGEFHRAVRKGNPNILKLVEEGFARISDSEYRDINQKWLGMEARADYVYLRYILTGLGALTVIALFLLAWNWTLRRRVRQRTVMLEEEIALNRKDAATLQEAESVIRVKHVELSAVYQQLAASDNELREKYRELSKSKQELTESEEKYRNIFENAREGIYQSTPEGRFIHVNPAMAGIFGYETPDDLVQGISNISTQIYANPEDRKHMLEMLEKYGHIENHESVGRRKDGRIIWLSINARRVFDDEGNTLYYEGFLQDITRRKQAADTLQASEEKFFKTFHKAPLMMTINEIENGTCLDVNKKWTEVSGFSREESLGKKSLELGFMSREDLIRLMKRLKHQGIVESMELYLQDKNKRQVCCLYSGEVITVGGKQVLLSIAQDITEKKKIEEEKAGLEERLHRSEKMEALGTLAGGVAHDLNNILGALVGYSELLLMEISSMHPLRRHVNNILKSGERAAAIIQDLLTLARRGVSVSEVINLNKIIADYLATPELEALQSFHLQVTIKTDLEKKLLNIKGSPVHLGKALMNLISNAAEAITGSGEITIKTGNIYLDKPLHGYDDMGEGEYVVLKISDTGKGIAAKDVGKIFEPFYTKKVMGRSGTGLGLAVVWGTVKDHYGFIEVQSEESKGSTFNLYFPVTREAMPGAATSVSITEYMGKGETILVIDDVKEQRDLAAEMLTKLNYQVSGLSSGEKAIAYIKEHKVDLLVLDMIMDPGIDGLETYQRILKVNPTQKAIIVSGFSETERVNEAHALGAGAYVKKPYILEKLGMAVRKEIDRSV
jgi:PAS domain S-box-containing protein